MHDTIQCPACSADMKQQASKGKTVDVCPRCDAVWLDRTEFDAVVAERFAGMSVEDLLGLTEVPSLDARTCPRDHTVMTTVFFQDLELDRCPTCEGIFVDPSDRAQLRARAQYDADVASVRKRPGSNAPRHPTLDELDTIELADIDAERNRKVICAGCAALTTESACIKRLDAFWCEACFVAGDYPGGHGAPVQKRIAEAAGSLARAESRLSKAREQKALRDRNLTKAQRAPFVRGYRPTGGWQHEEFHLMLERLGDAARDVLDSIRKRRKD